jgi:hypothetical protein
MNNPRLVGIIGRVQDNPTEINDEPSYEAIGEVTPAPATRGFFRNEADAARALSVSRHHKPSEESMSKAHEARAALIDHLAWADAEYPDREHDQETAARYVLAVAAAYEQNMDHLDPVEDRETIEGAHQILNAVYPHYEP